MTPSILIIGASGRTGLEIIRSAAHHPTRPALHALVRTPSKLPQTESKLCSSVIKGNATSTQDIIRALTASSADTVVIAIGAADTRPSDIREKSAEALVSVVKPGSKFEHVRIVCMSSDGAGDSKIKIGLGFGKVLTHYLRHVLDDHNRQEAALKKGLGSDEGQQKRLLIVRPTGLTSGKARGRVMLSGSAGGPSRVDRGDVAKWIVDEVCGKGSHFGSAVGMTQAAKN